MSKPQVASEPSLEEILASIRKMISDDRAGPMPMPDQMSRTPFGESVRSAPEPDLGTRAAAEPAPRRQVTSTPSFNSLADALKVATALSDQRNALQQELADAVEKSPRSNFDALSEVSAARVEATRGFGDARATPVDPVLPARRADTVPAPLGEAKRDLLSFDFGAAVPREEPEAKAEQPVESRVLQLRTGLGGGAGLAGPNVSPFPRPAREPIKPVEPELPSVVEKAPEAPPVEDAKPDAVEAATEAEPQPEVEVLVPAAELPGSGPSIAHSEALLDAVINLVKEEPGALSVFASGASFITGVGGHAAPSTALVETTTPVVADAPEAPAPSDPAKVDRAAADLLRPMLRQWLSENMGRILEEALRNELSDQTQGGKGSGKS